MGLDADPRDYYPGINLATLLLARGTEADLERLESVIPVVKFAVARRGGLGSRDYWDRAAGLELAVIAGDEPLAGRAKATLLAAEPPDWMLQTTAGNLRLLVEAGRSAPWVTQIADALDPPP